MTPVEDGFRTTPEDEEGGVPDAGLLTILRELTPKQHEVMRRVAENRTSKEIAWDLGVSESAVNQRIEAVRSRTGGALRAELARAYRQYLEEKTYKPLTGNILQVSGPAGDGQSAERDEPGDALALADAVVYTVTPPWQGEPAVRIVPEVLDGTHAGFSRIVAMIGIAAGILLVAMIGLGVIHALTELI